MKVSVKPNLEAQFREFSPKYIAGFEAVSGQLAHCAIPDFATGVVYHALAPGGLSDGYVMTQFGVWWPIDGATNGSATNKTLLEFDSAIPMADDRARRVVLLLRKVADRQNRSGWLETVRIDQTKSPRIGGEILTAEDIPNVYKIAKLPPEKLSLFFERAMRYVDWCASDNFPKGTPYEY